MSWALSSPKPDMYNVIKRKRKKKTGKEHTFLPFDYPSTKEVHTVRYRIGLCKNNIPNAQSLFVAFSRAVKVKTPSVCMLSSPARDFFWDAAQIYERDSCGIID